MNTSVLNKVYCTCGNLIRFHPLQSAGQTKNYRSASVCALCRKPTYYVWREWLENCVECLRTFSSPWEKVCKTCHISNEGTHEGLYRGWKWAAKQHSVNSLGQVYYPTNLEYHLDLNLK